MSFDFNNCYINTADTDIRKGNQIPSIPIGEFIGRFTKDRMTVHCGVLFGGASSSTHSVGFRVHESTKLGAVLQEGIAGKEMTFIQGKSNAIDVQVSDFGATGRVWLELFLVDANKKQVTPPLALSYDIPTKNPVGSVDGAFMNSDSFKKGDEIKAFVLSSLVPQGYRAIRLNVKNSNGAVCADEKVIARATGTLVTTSSKENCVAYIVAVTLLNKDDAEIGYLTFSFPSKPMSKTLVEI
ncbi:MAG: hypothetical protein G01um101491_172, partial [Parcubacteria group bacterium Gr01-1014_91]